MSILNESAFLTVDLGALFKSQSASSDEAKKTPKSDSEEASDTTTQTADKKEPSTEENLDDDILDALDLTKDLPEGFDWDMALRQVKPNADLREQFWNAYFTRIFGAEMVKPLEKLGDALKQDLENWELDPTSKNPLIPFFKQKFIQSTLIKLIDSERYQAIHTAIEDTLMADSEFRELKSYNVLYCKNLYKKSSAVMIEYFKLQKTILYNSKNSDSKKAVNRNKRILFDLGGALTQGYSFEQKIEFQRSAQIEHALKNSVVDLTLNELNLAKAILSKYDDYKTASDEQEVTSDTSNINTISSDIQNQAKKANSYTPIAAALMHLATNLNNTEAAAALQKSPFTDVKMSDALKYFSSLNLANLKVNTSEANQLVKSLISTKL